MRELIENSDESQDVPDEKRLAYTTTREPFIPVRLYYTTRNQGMLIKALKKLKCVSFGYDYKEFAISYFKETKNIGLEVGHLDVPQEIYPINLATGYIKQNSILHIDLRSLKRAVAIIEFLTKHIPPSLLRISALAHGTRPTVVNGKETADIMNMNYDKFFDESRMLRSMPELIDVNDAKGDGEEAAKAYIGYNDKAFEADNVLDKLINNNLTHFAEVEKIDIEYSRERHDDIISDLNTKIMFREMMIMMRHKSENSATSFADNIRDMIASVAENISGEILSQEFDERIEEIINKEILKDSEEDEYAEAWHSYLKDNISFPFNAICTDEYDSEDPLEPRAGEAVEILALAGIANCRAAGEVLVRAKRKDGTIIYPPLGQFEGIGIDDKTKNSMLYWDYWVKQLYIVNQIELWY